MQRLLDPNGAGAKKPHGVPGPIAGRAWPTPSQCLHRQSLCPDWELGPWAPRDAQSQVGILKRWL